MFHGNVGIVIEFLIFIVFLIESAKLFNFNLLFINNLLSSNWEHYGNNELKIL